MEEDKEFEMEFDEEEDNHKDDDDDNDASLHTQDCVKHSLGPRAGFIDLLHR